MIIGFTGKKQSGKTSATKCIKNFHAINFKDPLIVEVSQKFPDLLKEIQTQSGTGNVMMELNSLFDIKPPLIRKLLQNYGTDVRRNDDEDYWVKKWLERISDQDGDIMADDVRFLNEAKAIKDSGGIIIKIVRDGVEDVDMHISEMEMDKITPDYIIENNGTLEDLCAKINSIKETHIS